MKQFFITGTDTEIGKTYVSCGLLQAFSNQGYVTAGIKPLASGLIEQNGVKYNEDAYLLQRHASTDLAISQVNPICFAPFIAPHIAAYEADVALTPDLLWQSYANARVKGADVVIVEGVGGWHTPLHQGFTMADFVVKAQMPVIVVVGLRLGCLNHAMLTTQAIRQKGLNLAGWVANEIDPTMEHLAANVAYLQTYLQAPFLGQIKLNQDPVRQLEPNLGNLQLTDGCKV
jgi:dethiobiotin synthetase